MAGRIQDRVAVVTGGCSGIGLATVQRFVDEGAKVVVGDIDDQRGHELVGQLGGHDVLDLRPRRRHRQGAGRRAVRDRQGHLRLGGHRVQQRRHRPARGRLHPRHRPRGLERVQDVNLTSVYLCCKAALPYMLEQGRGSIINTASFVAVMGAATSQISYSASKGGVLSMTRELGVQFARQGVRVNALCPGPVNTPLLQELFATDAEARGPPPGARADGTLRASPRRWPRPCSSWPPTISSFMTADHVPRRRRHLRRLRHAALRMTAPVVGLTTYREHAALGRVGPARRPAARRSTPTRWWPRAACPCCCRRCRCRGRPTRSSPASTRWWSPAAPTSTPRRYGAEPHPRTAGLAPRPGRLGAGPRSTAAAARALPVLGRLPGDAGDGGRRRRPARAAPARPRRARSALPRRRPSSAPVEVATAAGSRVAGLLGDAARRCAATTTRPSRPTPATTPSPTPPTAPSRPWSAPATGSALAVQWHPETGEPTSACSPGSRRRGRRPAHALARLDRIGGMSHEPDGARDPVTDVLGGPVDAPRRSTCPTTTRAPVVATLVRRAPRAATGRAVLHVHGFADYFFQTAYAEWWLDRGYDFYAPRPAQVRPVAARPPDPQLRQRPHRLLRRARRGLATDHRARRPRARRALGPLHRRADAALWADRPPPGRLARPRAQLAVARPAGAAPCCALWARRGEPARPPARRRGHPAAPSPASTPAACTATTTASGTSTWPGSRSSRARSYAGWLRGGPRGHAAVHAGLDVAAPGAGAVLGARRPARPRWARTCTPTTSCSTSSRSGGGRPSLGRHVTYVAIDGARHDVFCRAPSPGRARYDELDAGSAYVDRPGRSAQAARPFGRRPTTDVTTARSSEAAASGGPTMAAERREPARPPPRPPMSPRRSDRRPVDVGDQDEEHAGDTVHDSGQYVLQPRSAAAGRRRRRSRGRPSAARPARRRSSRRTRR